MKVSRQWLEALLRRRLETGDLVKRLVMLGAEVDGVEPLHPELRQVVVGLVESVRPHPDADRLRLCTVLAGGAEPHHVVCGAPNVTAGKRYPFARVGTTLPGGLTLERRKIRGEVSEGMLCSARELGLGQEHDGILELETDVAPGTPLTAVMPVDDDRLLIDVTPNRPDLLGHRGVARELAHAYGVPLRLPEIPGATGDGLGTLRRVEATRARVANVTVGTEDTEGCRRFTAVVITDVRVGPSPEWLASRLQAVGVRSINNVVDATNYVMLELNHPMHAYDLAQVKGPEIIARRAHTGETITTLDGTSRPLNPGMTVIADAARAVGVGGVMGAENTEVGAGTTSLLVECAWFDPGRIRRTRRALGLSTDASYRFERGVDLWGLPEAQRRCAELIVATAGGRVVDAVDVWPDPSSPPRIFLRSGRVAQVLGTTLAPAAIEKYLVAIGCTVLYKPEDARFAVDVPGWRPDLTGEIDLIEEVARLHGYDAFPSHIRPYRVGRLGDGPMDRAMAHVREGLAARGLLETHSLPLGPAESGRSVRLLNPLAADDAFLRESLLSSLRRAVQLNWSRQVRDIRLFEVGTVFVQGGAGLRPVETTRVAGVLSGAREPAHWTGGGEVCDGWDLRALFEAAVALANPSARLQVESDGWGAVAADGRSVGFARRLSDEPPAWAAPVFGFELDLSDEVRLPARFTPLPTTPAAWRDINVVMPEGATVADAGREMHAAVGKLLESATVVSEFRADEIGAGRRAVQFRLTFRAADRTVRDEEVDAAVGRILKVLEARLGARLRTS
ncbi:MAG: phenylalanine--tRNA ligase subunit beta [Gemmatimonadota bacterium]|nr:phenylalanine--tRNA ligase subunit beta [Gemmatimonadota bacterium]